MPGLALTAWSGSGSVLIKAGDAPDNSSRPDASPIPNMMGVGSPTEHPVLWRAVSFRAHTWRMRYILLALLAVGCGSSVEGTTDWSVMLGSWETPTCEGTMHVTATPTPNEPTKLAGTWKCGSYGSQATGTIEVDGRVFLDLETTPGFLNHVRGTLADTDAIAGDILLDGSLVSFAAYRQ